MPDSDSAAAARVIQAVLKDEGVTKLLEGDILSYAADMLADMTLEDADLVDCLLPILLDSGCSDSEEECTALINKIVKRHRGGGDEDVGTKTPSTVSQNQAGTDGLRKLATPVLLMEKSKDVERALSRLKGLQLGFKISSRKQQTVVAHGEGYEGEDDEDGVMARAKNEKKLIKAEKRAMRKELSAANERSLLIDRITRAPMVIHPGSPYAHLLEGEGSSSSSGNDINLKNVSMDLGGLSLLDGVTLSMSYGRRYGLIGRNGIGKTTFLKFMAAKAFPGIPAHLHVLHIQQEVGASDLSVVDTVLKTDVERDDLLQEEAAILAALDQPPTQAADEPPVDKAALTARLNEVYNRLEQIEASTAPGRAASILAGLGFTPDMQKKATKDFSGGWRMRVSIAIALFICPDVLLLDEPTNHLDLHAVLWLENYLKGWKKILIVVSHARDFLDSIVTDILHFQNKTIMRYKGDYTNFEKRREEMLKTGAKKDDSLEKEILHMKTFIDKFRANASKASMVQSRIKAMQKLQAAASSAPGLVVDPEIKFNFPQPEALRSGQANIELVNVWFTYPNGKDPILRGVDFQLSMDSRICLVGPNGVGKSTLLKLIHGDMEPTAGTVVRSNINIGRFSQHHVEQLQYNKSALEIFKEHHPKDPMPKIRGHLSSLGITGKLQVQPVKSLSGGQKSRVALAMITYTRPHMLLLDEPTNHLDLDTVEALIIALSKFEGGLFVISHDEHMITSVCDELWVMDGMGLHKYKEDFEHYKKLVLAGTP